MIELYVFVGAVIYFMNIQLNELIKRPLVYFLENVFL